MILKSTYNKHNKWKKDYIRRTQKNYGLAFKLQIADELKKIDLDCNDILDMSYENVLIVGYYFTNHTFTNILKWGITEFRHALF